MTISVTPTEPPFRTLPDQHSDFPVSVTGDFWPLLVLVGMLAGLVALLAFFLARRNAR